jgi:two-component system CheB/CheR fusion protein
MQGRKFTHEPYAKHLPVSNPSINPKGGPAQIPPIVCLLLPGGEVSLNAPLLRWVLGIPGAAYFIVDAGPFDPGGNARQTEVELHAVVQRYTILPVVIAGHGTKIEANQVYLANCELSLRRDADTLTFRSGMLSSRRDGMPDNFLAAVAAMAPDRHIVVLPQRICGHVSGGLRVVRAEGGFVLAFAEDDGFVFQRPGLMPADLVLSPAETAPKLQSLITEMREGKKLVPGEREDGNLARIYLQLLRKRGMDFARRRQPDILRRIRRRMMIHGVATLEEYARIVAEEAEEIALFEELRISVAGFFLEPTVEHALLNDVLPGLLERHPPAAPLRVWIPCCCGGQEAYATAIFLSEYLYEQKKELKVQIFATDLNKAAAERSRSGLFDASELAGLGSRKRKRYFTKSQHGYQVATHIREMCIFATQNLFKDPPFSHVDIIFGFSALRGLNRESLDGVFRIFHYALRQGGCMLSDELEPTENLTQLFQRVRSNPSIYIRQERAGAADVLYLQVVVRPGEREADNMLLSGYVPPTLLVDDQLRVVRFYGNTEPYLRFSRDRLSLYLLQMVRDELVFELEELIGRSNEEGGTVVKNGIQLGAGPAAQQLSIEVTPLRSHGEKWKLIIIREMTAAARIGDNDKSSRRTLAQKDQRIRELEKEAGELRRLLLAAGEDATRIEQTLQRANEEMMASNEELQGVNEQLQSVNQQLLSLNVELNTVNEDLRMHNRNLELSLEYTHAVVSSLRRPMVVLQDDLRIKLANELFAAFFGAAAADLQGQSLYTVGHSVLDRDELRKALRLVLSKKVSSAELELRVELADLGERILAIDIARMPKVQHVRPGLVLSLEDVTERKATEKFKDEFIGIASHELRTPAASIQAYAQLLYEELAAARDKHPAELAMKLSSQVARLTRLTKDLLDVTRISQGQMKLRKELLDIEKLITETVEELQVTTDIRLTVAEHPALPPVTGDGGRLRQVLVNLLGNAIKYAAGTQEIIIRPGAGEGKVSIAVQDFGGGMSKEGLRKIFDRYYRLNDGGASGYPGVGLGLYISAEIVRQHGGDIKVESEKNKGSIFTVRLPVYST